MAQVSVCRALAATGLLLLLVGADVARAKSIPASFADLASKLLPSVVNISTRQAEQGPGSRRRDVPRVPPGSMLEELFRQFRDGARPEHREPLVSLGSGFVIDPQGYIVTNNHVIEEADRITVTLNNGTKLQAGVVGRDAKTDLALLRVNPEKPLAAVTFGDSSNLRVGDWVLAIGNQFGLGGTVTTGIVSARQRDIDTGPYDDFIQTDASINRGNSGGPMFDLDGKVVGINTAIFTQTGFSIGIGFAIPSNLAEPIIGQLRQYGKARRGWLGVQIQDVDEELARGLDMAEPEGALVASVTKGSAAAEAGIEAGDVIIEFDGRKVGQMRQLPRFVAETMVGKEVEVVVWRRGKRRTVKAILDEFPEEDDVTAASAEPPERDDAAVEVNVEELGVTLSRITPELSRQFGIDEDMDGVVVVDVEPGGAAESKDIRPGMIVKKIGPDQRSVRTPRMVVDQLNRARAAGRSTILLIIEVDGDTRFVGLDIDKG